MKMPTTENSRSGRRRAFTLIELLVVVAIILILAGISLKVMSVVGSKAGLAKTDMVLEQVKNALAAYYVTYGSYPPVDTVSSTAPYNQPAALTGDVGVHRGLTAYLLSGKDGSALTRAFCNPEATKWEHYLDGVYSRDLKTNSIRQDMSMMDLTNMTFTIVDGWERTIRYSAVAPDYQAYVLSSEGPTTATNDDIYVTFQ